MSYTPGQRVEVALGSPPEWKPGTVRAYRVTRGYYNTVSVDLDEPRSRREAMSVSDSHLLIRPLTTQDYCPACKTEGVTGGAMH